MQLGAQMESVRGNQARQSTGKTPMFKQLILAATAAIALTTGAAQAATTTATAEWPALSAELGAKEPAFIIYMRGYMSRAQFQCGFNGYNPAMIAMAAAAAKLMPSAEATQETLSGGMKSFDRSVAHSNLRSACAFVEKSFPTFVRP
jgi:hypothetical protein